MGIIAFKKKTRPKKKILSKRSQFIFAFPSTIAPIYSTSHPLHPTQRNPYPPLPTHAPQLFPMDLMKPSLSDELTIDKFHELMRLGNKGASYVATQLLVLDKMTCKPRQKILLQIYFGYSYKLEQAAEAVSRFLEQSAPEFYYEILLQFDNNESKAQLEKALKRTDPTDVRLKVWAWPKPKALKLFKAIVKTKDQTLYEKWLLPYIELSCSEEKDRKDTHLAVFDLFCVDYLHIFFFNPF